MVGKWSSMAALFVMTTSLMTIMVRDVDAQDTTPPNVTCSDVTTLPAVPNSFLPDPSQYTYDDANPDPSGITYNVTFGFLGDLFPPGHTPVTLIAVDTFDNMATCLFFVENPLTELPVNCPNLNRTVATDTGQPTYNYTSSIGPSDVTKEILGYRYHGNVSVVPAMAVGSSLDVGTHQDTVVISDEALSKECVGYIVVQDTERPNVTCPAEITVSSTNVVQFSADVIDNVGASLIYSPQPGTRFSPGPTVVTVTARDEAGLNDTCSFMVQVSLSELPVQCPSDETIQLPSAESTYQYPPMTKDNLTLVDSTYQFYGEVTIDILVNGTENYTLPAGTYIITFRIDDTILNKTCSSVLTVEERQSSVSELPVECPSDETIQLPSAESTYQYPPMTKDNLTLVDSTYQFYGDVTIDILVNGTENYTLPAGTYIITFRIDDTILSKTCSSVLTVEQKHSSPQSSQSHRRTIVIASCLSVLGIIIIVIVCCVYCVKKRRERRELEINKSAGKEITETTENILMESTPEAH